MNTKLLYSTLSLAIMTSLLSATARADFRDNHPRRAQVNTREARQQNRIAAGVAQGTISTTQQAQLQASEAKIKAEEVADVQANGGYLTQSQKQQLNTELNAESQQIYELRQPSSSDSN